MLLFIALCCSSNLVKLKERGDLNKSGERLQQQVGELIGCVAPAEQGIDVVVLHVVAASGTQHVDGTGEQGRRLGLPGHALHLGLVCSAVEVTRGSRGEVGTVQEIVPCGILAEVGWGEVSPDKGGEVVVVSGVDDGVAEDDDTRDQALARGDPHHCSQHMHHGDQDHAGFCSTSPKTHSLVQPTGCESGVWEMRR
ncbi:hypothetical protein BHE74_00022626 [Ensete ventricosum]|nr:hypothetical protein GW17_00002080 [Ensete ventricosum]RWW69744.1 hypothetical protein BHE74_00022626 [Ensete ventricosum]RZR82023.1 hypothetical protein BHM03_00008361 [Ensete ventricosum]